MWRDRQDRSQGLGRAYVYLSVYTPVGSPSDIKGSRNPEPDATLHIVTWPAATFQAFRMIAYAVISYGLTGTH
jgi:hypothetical protein